VRPSAGTINYQGRGSGAGAGCSVKAASAAGHQANVARAFLSRLCALGCLGLCGRQLASNQSSESEASAGLLHAEVAGTSAAARGGSTLCAFR
jgi:hypothetical protein